MMYKDHDKSVVAVAVHERREAFMLLWFMSISRVPISVMLHISRKPTVIKKGNHSTKRDEKQS